MGAIHDSMNEKLIESEIKEALAMLECATDLSTSDLATIQQRIDAGEGHLVFWDGKDDSAYFAIITPEMKAKLGRQATGEGQA